LGTIPLSAADNAEPYSVPIALGAGETVTVTVTRFAGNLIPVQSAQILTGHLDDVVSQHIFYLYLEAGQTVQAMLARDSETWIPQVGILGIDQQVIQRGIIGSGETSFVHYTAAQIDWYILAATKLFDPDNPTQGDYQLEVSIE
jgi:hypothetical protein